MGDWDLLHGEAEEGLAKPKLLQGLTRTIPGCLGAQWQEVTLKLLVVSIVSVVKCNGCNLSILGLPPSLAG